MHNGSLATLDAVIDHYSRNFSPARPLNFTESEKAALIGFLKTLTDRAFLTDVRFSDPFGRAAQSKQLQPACPATTERVDDSAQGRFRVNDAIARMLSFDRNADGVIGRDEVPERMADVVSRGDTNRSGSLDAEEIRAIASSQLRARSGTGIIGSDAPVALQVRPPQDSGQEAFLTDLALDKKRHAAALAALSAGHVETVLTATELADFRASMGRNRPGLVAVPR
jgi:hypothetical protein